MAARFWQRICLAIAMLAASTAQHGALAVETSDTGQTLIISYHAEPAKRSALQHELAASGARQFAKWKSQGLLKDYKLLLNRYPDSGTPDAVALLSFSSAADEQRLRRTEKDAPSGLTPKAMSLVSAIYTAPVALMRSKRSAAETPNSVFVVIPYETLVSAAEYLKYADGYAIPQFEGWMRAGVLSDYEIFTHRFPAGRPWTTMVILEYKDDAALDKREAVLTSVRAELKNNPEWKAISENKKNIRNEKQVVIANAVAAPSEK